MVHLSCVTVKRDKIWFQEQIPKAQKFWNDVNFYRQQKLNLEEIRQLKEPLLERYGKNINKKTSPSSKYVIEVLQTKKCLLDDSDDESDLSPSIKLNNNKQNHIHSIPKQQFVPNKFVPNKFVPHKFVPNKFVPNKFVPNKFNTPIGVGQCLLNDD